MKPSRSTSINIADISRGAGVTRSAFYFYCENEAAVVAALMEQMYDDALVATELLTGDGQTPKPIWLRTTYGTTSYRAD
jgi:TetR/AcrR family transcriptional regulator, ethionamide resistance regulator